jgi:hypothetical protein
MWAEVVEVARAEDVEATAHSLQLDPAQLTTVIDLADYRRGDR